MLDSKDKKIISLLKQKGAEAELAVTILLYIKEEKKGESYKDKIIKYIEENDTITENDIISNLLD